MTVARSDRFPEQSVRRASRQPRRTRAGGRDGDYSRTAGPAKPACNTLVTPLVPALGRLDALELPGLGVDGPPFPRLGIDRLEGAGLELASDPLVDLRLRGRRPAGARRSRKRARRSFRISSVTTR